MTQKLDPDVQRYLTTLRRIPKEVRLSLGGRAFYLNDVPSCLCGWAVRDALLAMSGVEVEEGAYYWHDAVSTLGSSTAPRCVQLFGGSYEEWVDVFLGVTSAFRLPAIETAFTLAVMEAAGVARVRA